MLNILVVDDLPALKTSFALDYLRYHDKIEFNCEYATNVNSASRYIKNHSNEINLIILDLGLPILEDSELDALNGLYVLQFMKRYKIKIPVIINSTTAIPDEEDLIEDYKEVGIDVRHVTQLDGCWLGHFIKCDLSKNS